MLKSNQNITYTGDEMLEVLKEMNLILLSLHNMGSYYGEKFHQYGEEAYRGEYETETTRFIDEWEVTQRLAKVRKILSSKFDSTLGIDDMDDIERALEDIKYWTKPNDKPNP
ncbi:MULTISPECIES: hypothetical protein [Bacillus]|jgi:hypothetical protein|uniref:hypothetical protein n=1 Tax=Bacillus TaxID=1386 RepID=UPI00065D57F5|nr:MULTISPECIES: hypothetical protein [Bacillus]MBW4848988.1 hypothetical protein [Bacillaceae bacterium]KMK72375.1 hypothetical protein ACJ64_01290 [Bacillus safensis]MBR0640218.1 hypothetical protein [Bacillus safensis]MBU5207791.1 hypothetical protein [Bacillus safensis]MBW4853613.1 hypothetical protein [Bacillaceae bacterium]